MQTNSNRTVCLSPKLAQPSSTRAMMLDVLVALLPALGMAVFLFGPRVLLLSLLSVVSCLAFEFLHRSLTHQDNSTRDLSACVTGLLLAMSLPASASYGMVVLGAAFAIIVVKQFFGGLGKNFMNPALGGRMLLATFPVMMTTWSAPLDRLSLFELDAVTTATPMAYLHADVLPSYTIPQLLLGYQGGCLGEVSAFMLLLGGIYLIVRDVISPRIPVSFLGTVAVVTFLSAPTGIAPAVWMLTQLFSGGLILGAFFLATDPTTSPITPKGQLMFGVGCGLLTVLLRYYSSYPEGIGWAILTMNCFVWLFDRIGMPRRYGEAPFATVRHMVEQTKESLREIRFVKPNIPFHSKTETAGMAPGEVYLDEIRAQFPSIAWLGGTVLTMGILIFVVHSYTDLAAVQAETRAEQALLEQVMPKAAFSSESPYRANGALSIQSAFSKSNEHLGYCVEVQSQGFSGMLTMVVGVDLDGTVTGVAVTNHSETQSVVEPALTTESLKRYVGLSGTIRTNGSNAVDAVSGATATSKAITAGVNRALSIIASLDTEAEILYDET